jgi:hypothetical protein
MAENVPPWRSSGAALPSARCEYIAVSVGTKHAALQLLWTRPFLRSRLPHSYNDQRPNSLFILQRVDLGQ